MYSNTYRSVDGTNTVGAQGSTEFIKCRILQESYLFNTSAPKRQNTVVFGQTAIYGFEVFGTFQLSFAY